MLVGSYFIVGVFIFACLGETSQLYQLHKCGQLEMTPEPSLTSSILYQNSTKTVFLTDIPTSIALGQTLSLVQHPDSEPSEGSNREKSLLSSPPLKIPYPTATEPKTESARTRVLQRIPASERLFHAEIEPLIRDGLGEIREFANKSAREWCLPRHVVPDHWQENGDFRKRKWTGDALWDTATTTSSAVESTAQVTSDQPPVILSSTSVNGFESMAQLQNVAIKNPSGECASLRISHGQPTFSVPPLSSFVLCTLPTTQSSKTPEPIPGLSGQKFNLVLFDPPWPNRSARRGRQYLTNHYFNIDALTQRVGDILHAHLAVDGLAAIWVTNSEKSRRSAYDAIQSAGLRASEEWIWLKTTTEGEPLTPVDGVWRKPYEVLVIGKAAAPDGLNASDDNSMIRRVIAAVPDVHSRKPNLREVFEQVFFTPAWSEAAGAPYSALEVFARNLTAGWWACGNEVLKFNDKEWWVGQ